MLTDARAAKRTLSAERSRLVAETTSVRRTSTIAFTVTSLIVLVGGVVIALLIHAEQTVGRLGVVTNDWHDQVSSIQVRAERLLDPTYRADVPNALVTSLSADIDHLAEREEQLSREFDDLITAIKGEPVAAFSFIDAGAISELERTRVDPTLVRTATELAPHLAAQHNAPLTEDERRLDAATRTGGLVEPANLRVAIVSSAVATSRAQFRRWVTVLFTLIFVILLAVWAVVFGPALLALRELTDALDRHAAEVSHSYLTTSAAQRVARLGSWIRRGVDGPVVCSDELADLIGTPPSATPTDVDGLAALSPRGASGDVLDVYRSLSASPGTAEATRVIERGDADPITVRERVKSVEEDGRIDLIGVMLDVTDIERAQEVVHRTTQLDLVELLVSGVAHDFNNLLAIIVGNAELAARTANAAQLPHLDRVLVACDTARSLIQQLRGSSLSPSRHAENVRAADLVRDVATSFECSDDVQLACDVDRRAEGALVLTDAALFDAAVRSLVQNALDSFATGPGQVVVRVERPDEQVPDHLQTLATVGRMLTITVVDDGEGMSDAVRRRATQPFFSTRAAAGSDHAGLGLWTAYAFAKSSGGDLRIESTEGVGTTVRLVMPCVLPNDPPSAAPAPAPLSVAPEPATDDEGDDARTDQADGDGG